MGDTVDTVLRSTIVQGFFLCCCLAAPSSFSNVNAPLARYIVYMLLWDATLKLTIDVLGYIPPVHLRVLSRRRLPQPSQLQKPKSKDCPFLTRFVRASPLSIISHVDGPYLADWAPQLYHQHQPFVISFVCAGTVLVCVRESGLFFPQRERARQKKLRGVAKKGYTVRA